MDRKHIPTREASVRARVNIGRIVKKARRKRRGAAAVPPKIRQYYWVTGKNKAMDEQGRLIKKGTRACTIAVGVGGTLTYPMMVTALSERPTAHPQIKIRNIIAIEITAEDYDRLSKYEGYVIPASGENEKGFATIIPFEVKK